jgi:hypothetical protein
MCLGGDMVVKGKEVPLDNIVPAVRVNGIPEL